jgi:hypothetical protein
VIGPSKKLLVPLETKCKGMRWHLDRLYYAVIGTGTDNDRTRQLSYRLAMKRINENSGLSDQGGQPGIRGQHDLVEVAALVVLQNAGL